MPAEALLLDNVTKRYGRRPPVIHHLSHRFEPGTATGLVGPNGAGKTTLLRLLWVLARPSEGVVRYGELNIHEEPYRYLAHVGIVHDEEALPLHASAVEFLTFVLRHRGQWEDNGPARIAELLDTLRLDAARHDPVGTYSTGMRKKTQIAAALIHRPDVLLMDEPFRGLDVETLDTVVGLLQRFASAGGLLVLSSHQREPLDTLATETIALGTT